VIGVVLAGVALAPPRAERHARSLQLSLAQVWEAAVQAADERGDSVELADQRPGRIVAEARHGAEAVDEIVADPIIRMSQRWWGVDNVLVASVWAESAATMRVRARARLQGSAATMTQHSAAHDPSAAIQRRCARRDRAPGLSGLVELLKEVRDVLPGFLDADLDRVELRPLIARSSTP